MFLRGKQSKSQQFAAIYREHLESFSEKISLFCKGHVLFHCPQTGSQIKTEIFGNKEEKLMFKLSLSVAILVFFALFVLAQSPMTGAPLLIGRVSINQTHIAFVHAGKIWLVERAGGQARFAA
jgi:hypothetical protein